MVLLLEAGFVNDATTEIPSLFHANMEMKNMTKNSLNHLRIGDDIISDHAKIEETVVDFFHALFNGYHDTSLKNTEASFVPKKVSCS